MSDEIKKAYVTLRDEIFDELRSTLQFALSQGILNAISISDLPPQFDQLRKQMIEAYWGMFTLRILIILDSDNQNSCSLSKFINHAHSLKIINSEERNNLNKRLESLINSEHIKTAKGLRDTVIAHSDKKKPAVAKMTTKPMIQEIEAIFMAAGGMALDIDDLESKMTDSWHSMYELMRIGMIYIPKK